MAHFYASNFVNRLFLQRSRFEQNAVRTLFKAFRRHFINYSGLTKISTALPRLSSKRTIL
ncbi:hypothetical protein EJF89_11170 [Neisseria meningitidis]|nr:hypothetical protein [Neisseria meningitidis]